MHRLANPVRHYAWGSHRHIPKLCGLPGTGEPWAEMWLGAHPADPSRVEDGRGLDEVIADDPVGTLGPVVAGAFGPRLPFLMKLLAAAEPLSLQVHPAAGRARIRYAEQEAAGIAPSARERSYPDASHKPELLYALTRFEGMAGFRDVAGTAGILRSLALPWLSEIADEIDHTPTPFQTLRGVTTRFLGASGPALRSRLVELRAAAVEAERRAHQPGRRPPRPRDVSAQSIERESVRVFAQTAELVDRYPDDPGVLVTLLLNHVVLAAGEAMYVAPGVVHAYTSGFGVEIMASSDNVVRAGLTSKFVDVSELLEITDFTPIPAPRWGAVPLAQDGGILLSPPVDEFELAVVDVDGPRPGPDGRPSVVLCLDGEVAVRTATGSLTLGRGGSVFVGGREGATLLDGRGRAALGRTPR